MFFACLERRKSDPNESDPSRAFVFFQDFFAAENFVQNTLCVLVREEGLAAKRKRRPKYMKQTFSTVQKFTRSSSTVIRPAA